MSIKNKMQGFDEVSMEVYGIKGRNSKHDKLNK